MKQRLGICRVCLLSCRRKKVGPRQANLNYPSVGKGGSLQCFQEIRMMEDFSHPFLFCFFLQDHRVQIKFNIVLLTHTILQLALHICGFPIHIFQKLSKSRT